MKPQRQRKANWLLVDVFDFYGQSFNLHIFSKPKYKTFIGSVLGFLSLILMAITSIYFIIEMFERKSMSVILNDDLTKIPVNNLSDSPFLITIGDFSGQPINPGLFSLDVKMFNYKVRKMADGSSKFAAEIVPIEVEKCDITKHFSDKGYMFKGFDISGWFCIPPSKYNLTIYGRTGDNVNGWSNLAIYFNKCNPNLQKCLNKTYSESALKTVIAGTAFLTSTIDHYNSTSPSSLRVENVNKRMSTSLFKNYNVYLQAINYKTDYGLIFEDLITSNFFTVQDTYLDVSMSSEGLPTTGENIGYYLFYNYKSIANYSRSYIKGQAVIANIGGIIKSIMVIAHFISTFLTRRMSYLDISNTIFQFKLDDKSSPRKNPLNNTEGVSPISSRMDSKFLKSKDRKSKESLSQLSLGR
jgi:hypothetical protein